MGRLMYKAECPVCGSVDNVSVFDSGDYESWHCFTPDCTNRKADGDSQHKFKFYEDYLDTLVLKRKDKVTEKFSKEYTAKITASYNAGAEFSKPERSIPSEVLNRFGFKQSAAVPGRVMTEVRTHKGELIGYKWRNLVKDPNSKQNFGWIPLSDSTAHLVFQQLASVSWGVVIYEGELDAASGYAMHPKLSHVSVPNGAEGALKAIDNSQEFLSRFGNVYICFDQDEAGDKAKAKVLAKYPEYKVIVLPNGCKDANECLQKGLGKQFADAVYAAKNQDEDFIVSKEGVLNDLLAEENEEGFDSGLQSLNTLLGGLRAKEITTLIGAAGKGKSTYVRQLAYAQCVFGRNTIVVSSEESAHAWVKKLYRMHTGQYGKHVARETIDFMWEHITFIDPLVFEATEEGVIKLFKAVERTARARDASLVIIDNITHLTKGATSDYYKLINRVSPEFVRMGQKTGAHFIVVGHETKKVGEEPAMHDGDGTGGLNQLSHNVLSLKRHGESSALHLLKRRETLSENLPCVGTEDAVVALEYEWAIGGYKGYTYERGGNEKPVQLQTDSVPNGTPSIDIVSVPLIEDAPIVHVTKEPDELRQQTRETIPSTQPASNTDYVKKPPVPLPNKRGNKPQPRLQNNKRKEWKDIDPRMQRIYRERREGTKQYRKLVKDIKAGVAEKTWGVPLRDCPTAYLPTGEGVIMLADYQYSHYHALDPVTFEKLPDISDNAWFEACELARKYTEETGKDRFGSSVHRV